MAENTDPKAIPPAVPPVTEPVVPVVDEAAEARKLLAAERAKNDKITRELADAKAQGLKSKEDWKGVAALNETRANELEAENTRIKGAVVNDAKIKALTTEAVKAGINPISIPDLELLDFAEITTETSSNGKVVVSGANAAIANLKRLRPNWFTGEPPAINPTTPQGGVNQPNGNISLDMVIAAQDKYVKSKSDSDKKAYEDILIKYKAQK